MTAQKIVRSYYSYTCSFQTSVEAEVQNIAVGRSGNPWASSNVVGIICPCAEYNLPKSGNPLPPHTHTAPTALHLLKKISFSATQSDEIISEEKLST